MYLYALYTFHPQNLTANSQPVDLQTKKVRVRLYLTNVTEGIEMTVDYTPKTDEVRRSYVAYQGAESYSPSIEKARQFREAGGHEGAFDRWLTAHDREVRKTSIDVALSPEAHPWELLSFREAWEAADDRYEVGSRLRQGLAAFLERRASLLSRDKITPTEESDSLIERALLVANKGVSNDDGYVYSVPARDLAEYRETIMALVSEIQNHGGQA